MSEAQVPPHRGRGERPIRLLPADDGQPGRSAADYQDFFENGSIALHLVGGDGTILHANEAELQLLGYSAEEYVGRHIAEFHADRPVIEDILARLSAGETLKKYPARLRARDGSIRHVEITSSARFRDGRLLNTRCFTVDVTELRRARETLLRRVNEQDALFRFTEQLYRAESLADVYEAALDAILSALRCGRASILLFDGAGVMRFVAWRGLSEGYRRAVEGHSPWTPEARDPQPIGIDDIDASDVPEPLKATVKAEGIGALGFIPLMAGGKLVGKFMAYYEAAHAFTEAELDLGVTIGRQLGFSVQRIRAEDARRRAEAELRENEERARVRAAELQAIMEAVPTVIWIARDRECRTITGNQASYDFLRVARGDNLSLSAPAGERPTHFEVRVDGRVLRPEDMPVQRAARGEEVRNFEGEHRFDDGTSRYLFGNATPLRDARGEPSGAVAAFVDITDRRDAELALRAGEQRLQLALEAGRMGAWEWDSESGTVAWSPSLEEIHGLAPGAFGGRFEDFKRDIHPEDLSAVLEQIQAALETGQGYHVAYRIVRPDGAVRWLEAFGRSLPGADGRAQKLTGVCMDITERRQAEAQRDLLVAELSHRVKNTLATVISIAQQSFLKAPSVEEARRSFDGRIRALAQTHGRLAEANWSGVSFETLVLDELAPYRHEDGGNVRVAGPDIRLNPKCAVVLGMAFHELATNAAKYGALSSRSGSVGITWDVSARSSRQLRVRWIEAGGPPVVPPQRSGFGRLLLERVVASDLNGSVRLDFAKGGLHCEVAVPLDAAGLG